MALGALILGVLALVAAITPSLGLSQMAGVALGGAALFVAGAALRGEPHLRARRIAVAARILGSVAVVAGLAFFAAYHYVALRAARGVGASVRRVRPQVEHELRTGLAEGLRRSLKEGRGATQTGKGAAREGTKGSQPAASQPAASQPAASHSP